MIKKKIPVQHPELCPSTDGDSGYYEVPFPVGNRNFQWKFLFNGETCYKLNSTSKIWKDFKDELPKPTENSRIIV